jgi:hypothetical protein
MWKDSGEQHVNMPCINSNNITATDFFFKFVSFYNANDSQELRISVCINVTTQFFPFSTIQHIA